NRILAKINTQKYVQVENFSIHPELLLSVMEIIKFVMIKVGQSRSEFVNIKSIKNVEVFRKLNSPSYIYAHVRPEVESIFNIYILDRNEGHSSSHDYDSLLDFLVESVASALGVPIVDIEIDKAFVEMGLDSISAVVWIDAINTNYDCAINETKVYDYPNLVEFSKFLINEIRGNKASDKQSLESLYA
ncbi:acyl carrier protein, partial [Chromobacterium piscinae]|uniref:acyl carrier protein n=1 Tax=Chromobacterium piscinae TaxID=686831 RepID=UPI0031FCE362